MKIFCPLSTQPSPSRVARRLDAGGVGSRARLGEADRERALAPHRGLQPALALQLVREQQHLVDIAECAADQDVGGVAELLLGEARVDRRKPAAAIAPPECSTA